MIEHSTLAADERLTERVHRFDHAQLPASEEAVRIFRAGEMLVIDGVPWQANREVIRSGLMSAKRGPADPFGGQHAAPEVKAEIAVLVLQVEALRRALYPMECVTSDVMFRPMVSGPEPLHFDTFDDSAGAWISAFVNVSATPRQYRVGPNLFSVPRAEGRAVLKECKQPKEFSYKVRARTMRGEPPLNAASPRHSLGLAPGAIWFFNSKTVSHELVHGEGAVSFGWQVPEVAPPQVQILKELF